MTSRVFSSVTLHSGIVRKIGVLALPGGKPFVCVSRHADGRRVGFVAFHCGRELDALAEAVRLAADSQFRGRLVIARLPHGNDLVLELAVLRAPGHAAAVSFIRLRGGGEHVGTYTTINSSELASLAHACRWAAEAAQRPAEETTAATAALRRT